jgi:YVTN family beta-propeller protein
MVGVDARIGSSLREYRLDSLLGRGGMGTVFLAWDTRLERRVALKLLSPQLAEDMRFRERFLRESRLAASLDHPNVIPIYEAGEADGQLFIAMRFVQGRDLAALLESQGRLPPERALAIVGQLAAALDAAHEHELVHRDVKPGNVLLDQREHVYLCDFGLTKQASSISGLTGTGQLIGTLDYLAPEQIRGDPVDGRADIYSLGCLLYQCLTGQPPYHKDNEAAVLWGHIHDSPPAPSLERPELPKALDAVLARALAKDPVDRYQTAGELVHDAQAALAGQLRVTPTIRLPRRWRLLLALALVALAGALAATLALTLRDRKSAVTVKPNSVALIDANTNKIVADIPVGIDPTSIAATTNAVWVANQTDRTITRINPHTREVVRTIPIGNLPDPNIATGYGALWVTSSNGTLTRISPTYNQPTRTARAVEKPSVVIQGAPTSLPVATGAGAVWVADTVGYISRVGPTTMKVIARVDALAESSALAVDASGVWAVDGVKSKVRRFSLRTNAISSTFPVGQGPRAIALGEGAVWVAATADDLVTRIDPLGGSARTITTGRGPSAIAVGGGSIWVANSRSASVTRIDANSGRVVATIPFGTVPGAIAYRAGTVWVAALAGRAR